MNDVQQYADSLADQLNRSIEIDDCGLKPLALTEQHGDLDDVRVRSILQRHSSPEVFEYAFSLDIAHATGPVRFPANPALQTLPRVCIPMRAHGELHGYLWLIDSPPLTDPDITAATSTAGTIAELLHQQSESTATALDREARLVSALLAPPREGRPSAELLGNEPLLEFAEPASVLTTRFAPIGDSGETLDTRALRGATQEVAYARPMGHSLLGHGDDTIHLIVSAEVHGDRLRPFRHALTNAARRRGWMLRGTGVGAAASDLDDLRRSGMQSSYAASIAHARKVEQLSWNELGADLVFYGLPWTTDTLEILFPGASRLFDADNSLIRESLDAYFDCGGDTRRAAAQLAVHRTTLYYRLDRAQQLLGEDWAQGERRAGLQLALRLAMLIRNT
ncbi:helix-turn-helix domain-containing protein [Rhodococcus pseudokoreensis]|uniref:Helix-turn-helix domain-containing protein n=1 Tax=Rhodococcus pseudokoreensis TaxID=2811421 RepID=A0A974WBM7_9NOCA|nr:PucR family transcriptional regulator [Rhodococcus pseudokoreensis]QSE94903.1 helix-turn-helix domain-containing protein [Rhodococcus pseudokoreensis]